MLKNMVFEMDLKRDETIRVYIVLWVKMTWNTATENITKSWVSLYTYTYNGGVTD